MRLSSTGRAVLVAVASLGAATQATTENADADRPWLDPELPSEVRLQLFLQELNETQIYNMVEGDTVVRITNL
jgi:hypothetical protein